MRVYRVESQAGVGPYQTKWDMQGHMLEKHSRDSHMWDGVSRPGAFYGIATMIENLTIKDAEQKAKVVCGFTGELEMLLWFRDVWDWLADGEFYIAEYEVPENHVILDKNGRLDMGDLQCVFYRGSKAVSRRLIDGSEIDALPEYMRSGSY